MIKTASRIGIAGVAVAIATSLAFTPTRAADYPQKPVRLVAAIPPGSPPDVVARMLAERLATVFGQPVLVENRPGAIGTIGMNAVAKAAPDGYTLGVMTLPYTVAPSLLSNIPYDTARDLAPVNLVAVGSHILVVRSSSPIKSVADLIAFAKAKPGEITFASGGNGTPAHLAGELLRQKTGVQIRHVPFKGAPEGAAAVLGELVDMMFAATVAVAPQIKAGRMRALATSAPKRLATFPDVPTMVELGFSGFEIRDWQGVVAPAGTPPETIAWLAREIAKVTAIPEVKERLTSIGMEAAGQVGPEEFGALIRSEIVRWGKVVRDAGIHAD
ncbi:MAG: tripartite tricarboxylate transporter substrate binding protein [Burkholderiales bacterium]